MSIRPWSACVRFGSSARLPSLSDSVNALNKLQTLRPSKAECQGFTPFMENGRNQPVAAHTNIGGPDDEIVGVGVRNLGILVGRDAFVLMMPLCQQQADGAAHELGQVAKDVTGVARRLNLA